MSETDLKCSSCNRKVVNQPGLARFQCPGCSKHEIVRCKECRAKAVKYNCPSCGFDGPN